MSLGGSRKAPGGCALLLSDGRREDQWTKSPLARPEGAMDQNPPSGVV